MNRKQIVALVALPTMTLTMIPVFRGLAHWLGRKRAWYTGFLVYWPVWCIFFPLWIIGPRKLKALFNLRRLQVAEWFMLIVPPVLALLGRYTMNKPQRSTREKVVLVFMAFMNG